MLNRFSRGWYVLYVRSRYEKRVDEQLKFSGLTSYLPLIKKIKKWSDRKKIVEEPLFRSYVFVNIQQQFEFSRALSLDGVCDFVRFGNELAMVRDGEIENIRILLQGDLKNIETVRHMPQVGEVRKIQYGSLKGLECEILRINGENKILVRVNSIHTDITATVPLGCFQHAAAR
ncbi:MAG: UpxY family transcription antiterminator [Bacteroidota bacterium]